MIFNFFKKKKDINIEKDDIEKAYDEKLITREEALHLIIKRAEDLLKENEELKKRKK